MRAYVQTQLEGLAGSHGEFLTGGVTLAALQPMRPVPCQVLYVIGLDATLFPGSNALSSFDLRGVQRQPGDIRPAEDRTYLLLENLIAAQQKAYLLYNNRDTQKDLTLQPSMPLQQLQRYLGAHVTRDPFEPVAMPPFNDDDAFFNHAQQPEHQDVLVQYRDADRFIALSAATRDKRLPLDLHQQAELRSKADSLRVDFAVAPEPKPALATPVTIAVGELRRFLCFPAEATLRRHLRIEEDEESAALDEEPLITPDAVARQLVRLSLHQLVRRAASGDVNAALTEWPERFRAVFADSKLRSRVPEEAFGDIDFDTLRAELQERIHGKGGIEPFLRAHAEMQSCGPALLGESFVPIGAKMRFPALQIRPADPEIRVVGATPFAWFSKDTFEVLVVTTSKRVDARELCTPMIEPLLFYLALLANPAPNAKAFASSDWLSRRHFRLHVAHANGIQTWTYPIGLVSSEEARNYLVQLTQDFLDPAQLDLLPFELVTIVTDLRRAYDERSEFRLSAEQYVELLREKLADERDNPWNRALEIPAVVGMAGADIPADALAKVQRRFRLLDRGPALCRQGGAGKRGFKARATP